MYDEFCSLCSKNVLLFGAYVVYLNYFPDILRKLTSEGGILEHSLKSARSTQIFVTLLLGVIPAIIFNIYVNEINILVLVVLNCSNSSRIVSIQRTFSLRSLLDLLPHIPFPPALARRRRAASLTSRSFRLSGRPPSPLHFPFSPSPPISLPLSPVDFFRDHVGSQSCPTFLGHSTSSIQSGPSTEKPLNSYPHIRAHRNSLTLPATLSAKAAASHDAAVVSFTDASLDFLVQLSQLLHGSVDLCNLDSVQRVLSKIVDFCPAQAFFLSLHNNHHFLSVIAIIASLA